MFVRSNRSSCSRYAKSNLNGNDAKLASQKLAPKAEADFILGERHKTHPIVGALDTGSNFDRNDNFAHIHYSFNFL